MTNTIQAKNKKTGEAREFEPLGNMFRIWEDKEHWSKWTFNDFHSEWEVMDIKVICQECKSKYTEWIGSDECPECESTDLLFFDTLIDWRNQYPLNTFTGETKKELVEFIEKLLK